MVFGSPEVSFRSMAKPFEVRRLQMTSSNPLMSIFMRGQHVVNSCCLKLRFLGKMTFFKVWFWSAKIAVIQAKSFVIKQFSKKVEFFNIEERKYQTLFLEWITLLRLFHSQERFAIAHLYVEKIKFLKQKNMCFFNKKLMFYKEMSVFYPFLSNSELWAAGVVPMCCPRKIWHWGLGRYYLKSSHLKRFGHKPKTFFGASKKPFFLPYRPFLK